MANSDGIVCDAQSIEAYLGDLFEPECITDLCKDCESHPDRWRHTNLKSEDLRTDTGINRKPVCDMIADFAVVSEPRRDGKTNENNISQNEKTTTSKQLKGKYKKVEQKYHKCKDRKKADWRKYGQKTLLHKQAGVRRYYYKCNQENCGGKKIVDYVGNMKVDSDMTNPHSAVCSTKSWAVHMAEGNHNNVAEVEALTEVSKIEKILATCTQMMCVDMRLLVTPTGHIISEASADCDLGVGAWIGQPLTNVCTQMVRTEFAGKSRLPVRVRFYRTIVTLPACTAYALLKIKPIDKKSEHATIIISKENYTF